MLDANLKAITIRIGTAIEQENEAIRTIRIQRPISRKMVKRVLSLSASMRG